MLINFVMPKTNIISRIGMAATNKLSAKRLNFLFSLAVAATNTPTISDMTPINNDHAFMPTRCR